MSAPPPTTYLARTFGWSGSRQEWLAAAGVVAWLAAGVAIARYGQRLTIGETVLLYGVWLLSLAVAARDAVRNLFGPVFFYDIVRVGRQRLTFGLRLLYAGLVGAVLLMMYSSWLTYTAYTAHTPGGLGTNELSRFGTEFFQTFAVIQFVVVVLLTPVYVGGTICVEKERKTLEFLFATDLRNREIIFGKLASRVTNLLMFTLLGLPILTLVQLFGGVDPEQVLALFVATATTVVGLAAVSIWYSTMLKKARDAIMLTYLSYLAYCFASLFAAAYTNIAPFKGWWNTPVNLGFASVGLNDLFWRAADGNIAWQLVLMGNAGRLGTALGDQLARYVLFWAVVGGLFLGHAILRLRAVALAQSYGPSGGTRSRKKKVVTTTGAVEKVVVNERARALPPVGDNPVFWKEVFVDGGARGGVLGKVIAGLIVALLFVPLAMIVWFTFFEPHRYGYGDLWTEFRREVNAWVRGVTGVLTGLIVLSAAVRGAGAITYEKDKDSWVSLLSTPLTADEILTGKWWGVVLGLRRAYFLLVLVWSVGLVLGAANPVMVVLTAGAVALYTAAFAWVGLYFSMTARNTMVATVRGFFAALFLAGGFWAVVLFCCVLPMSFSQGGREFEPIGQFFAALTPPFLAGWLPMNEFRRQEYGPFEPDSYGIGLAAPVLGLMVWAGFTLFLWVGCRTKFRAVTNREAQRDESRSWAPKPPARAEGRRREPRGDGRGERRNRYE